MKAVIFTLGCKVNECESASLARALCARGWEVTEELEPADLYILNTCAVTAEAEKKSRQAVARIRAVCPSARIAVCGCAAERAPASFAEKEGVFLVSGARRKGELIALLEEGACGVRIDGSDAPYDEMPAPRPQRARAFVKIQDGCNNFCSYCIIPYLRGRTRSSSFESAAAEILASPAEEVVITGIDVSSYRDGARDLADLLLAVKDAPARIRLGSLEAGVITPRLLDAAAQVRCFAPHFHLSLQSGSDAVLKRMNRHYTGEEFLSRVALVRAAFPDAAVTTDIIAGFPGETEADFAATCALARRAGFSQIHAFPYSRRTGTVAARMQDVPPAVKKERLHRLLGLGEELRRSYEARFVGRTLELVPEERKGGYTVGYSENYIRLYVPGEPCSRARVRAVSPFRDGLLAELSPAGRADSAE